MNWLDIKPDLEGFSDAENGLLLRLYLDVFAGEEVDESRIVRMPRYVRPVWLRVKSMALADRERLERLTARNRANILRRYGSTNGSEKATNGIPMVEKNLPLVEGANSTNGSEKATNGIPMVEKKLPLVEGELPMVDGESGQNLPPLSTPIERIPDISKDISSPLPGEDGLNFADFWTLYGKKEAKKDAEAVWNRLGVKERRAALAAVPSYKQRQPNPQFRKLAGGWLRGRRWEDEPAAASETAPAATGGMRGLIAKMVPGGESK